MKRGVRINLRRSGNKRSDRSTDDKQSNDGQKGRRRPERKRLRTPKDEGKLYLKENQKEYVDVIHRTDQSCRGIDHGFFSRCLNMQETANQ